MKHSQRKLKEWAGRQADQRTRKRSNYVAAPSASKGTMRIYEELLKKAVKGKKNFKGCVLGATPETRDMVLKLGGELTTIDISWEMIQKCSALMKHASSDKEVVVKSSWLDSPLASNYFDVILGDGVSNNIHIKDQGRFFKELNRMLKKTGRLILREGVLAPGRSNRTIEEINQDFISGKIHWFDVFIDSYFYSDLSKRVHDSKTWKWYMGKYWKEVEKAYKQGRFSKKTFDAMWWFRGNLIHTFLPRARLEKCITKYFRLLPAKQAQDYKVTRDTFQFFFGKTK